jgi:hypothetical protein
VVFARRYDFGPGVFPSNTDWAVLAERGEVVVSNEREEEKMSMRLRKIGLAAVTAVAIAGMTVALPGAADARWGGWRGGHWHGGWGWGGWGVGLGLATGLAVAATAPYYRGYYGYYDPYYYGDYPYTYGYGYPAYGYGYRYPYYGYRRAYYRYGGYPYYRHYRRAYYRY